MPGQPVRIGPFVGGLNNVSTAGESKDEEVVELVNFELALDTSLISRPPIEVVSPIAMNRNWTVHGVYRITAADWYVVASMPTATGWDIGAWAKGDFTTSKIAIKTVTGDINKINGFVQYNDWCYFLLGSDSTIKCFRWKNGSSATDITNMPKGTALASWKDRLWVTGSQKALDGNYIWFSTVDSGGPKPDTWTVSTDFINIDPGAGGLNTALLPLTSSILIFKEDATYRFAFPNSPKNGEVVNLSRQIGAAGPTAVIGFENYAFVYDQGRIYELINTKFTQINLGLDLGKNSGINVDSVAPGVDLSVVSRRLIVRYYTSIYVYSVDTRTWSQWQSNAGTPGKFIELPGDSSSAQPSVFMAGMAGETQQAGLNRVFDPDFLDEKLNTKRAGSNPIVFDSGIATVSPNNTVPIIMYLSKSGTANYDISVGSLQTLEISMNLVAITATRAYLTATYLNYDGTSSTVTLADLTVGSNVFTTIVPLNSYLMTLALNVIGDTGLSASVSNPSLILANTRCSAGIARFVDGYQNVQAKELIECFMKTKAFDYQAGAVFKRLFLWGIDVVTPREIELLAIPLGRKASVTWDMASAYTWDQLAAGTWDNPLSWKGLSRTITDTTDPFTDISENGRFFVKAPKSLKFRQIQYAVSLSTLGNLDTGPAKLFTLTTYTKAGQMVVDKAT